MKLHPRLVGLARATGWLLIGVILFGLLGGVLSLFQAYQLSRVVSGVFLDGMALQDVSSFLRIILVIVFLRGLISFLETCLAGKMAVGIKSDLRKSLFEKIGRLGPVYLRTQSSGELVTTAMTGVESLEAYFAQYVPQVLFATILPLIILVVVFPMDLLSGLIFLFTAPLIPLFMILIGWSADALTKKQWLNLTRLGDFFLDSLQGIATLKTLGRSKDRGTQIAEKGDDYRRATLAVLRITFLSALALELVATISTAVIAVQIGLRLLYSRIEFQQAFFLLLIAPEFYLPLRNLSARYHAGMRGVTAATKIFEVLDEPEPEQFPSSTQPALTTIFDRPFTISFEDVSFNYPGSTYPALSGVNLVLRRGFHYALVGTSGAGKTTLAFLLLRMIDPDEGKIAINGIDIRSWSAQEWRRFLGWVPQNPRLFNDTYRENLLLGRDGFQGSSLLDVSKRAGLEELLVQLPNGLETGLGELGSRLSGGEAQRLAIARTILKDPPLILLDEPTSHLDPVLENRLLASLQELGLGRTTVTVAHRWSTVRSADEVIFLDKGGVIATGQHLDLVKTQPAYAALVRAGGVW